MSQIRVLQLPQHQETPTLFQQSARFAYRYAYARSADSQKEGDPGQDYLVIWEDENRLVFVLCDGVSQSFYGDLAARLLGNELAKWLWESENLVGGQNKIQANLEHFLKDLKEVGTKQVQEFPLPSSLAEMLKASLEKKRSIGSESTFVAGVVDTFVGQVVLAWMGDSRLRIWDQTQEQTKIFGKSFLTSERWSTAKGLVGQLHIFTSPIQDVQRILAYSDGLARLDERLRLRAPSHRAVNTLIAEAGQLPSSDDISFFELWVGQAPRLTHSNAKAPENLKTSREGSNLVFHWGEMQDCDPYEVEVWNRQGVKSWLVSGIKLAISSDQFPTENLEIRVRAWQEGEPGEWSQPVLMATASSQAPIQPVAETPTLSPKPSSPAPAVHQPARLSPQAPQPASPPTPPAKSIPTHEPSHSGKKVGHTVWVTQNDSRFASKKSVWQRASLGMLASCATLLVALCLVLPAVRNLPSVFWNKEPGKPAYSTPTIYRTRRLLPSSTPHRATAVKPLVITGSPALPPLPSASATFTISEITPSPTNLLTIPLPDTPSATPTITATLGISPSVTPTTTSTPVLLPSLFTTQPQFQ